MGVVTKPAKEVQKKMGLQASVWLTAEGQLPALRIILAPRRQERQVRKFNFFATFAPLREIFRVSVAAQPS